MGELELARRSVAALAALKQAETGEDPARRADLAAWPGWGPLAKAFSWSRIEAWTQIAAQVRELTTDDEYETARNAVDTAFYTPPAITAAVWEIVTGLGFGGGKVLEPGCGGGNFIAAAPAGLDVDWTGVEADQVSARIAARLYPAARIIPGRLEKTPLRSGGYDAAVGNVPFSSEGPYDPTAPKDLSLHNYFIWRALSAVRPGGLVALVTSRWTLDAADPRQRAELGHLGAFIGAIRLPGAAFGPAGTGAVADIIVFRRRTSPGEGHADARWQDPVTVPDGLPTGINPYFQANPGMVAGEMTGRAGQRYGMTLDVTLPGGADLPALLGAAVRRLIAAGQTAGLGWLPRPTGPEPGEGYAGDADPAREGAYTLHQDGTVTRQRDGRHEPVRAAAELVSLIRLRDAALALFAAEADPCMNPGERGHARQAAMRLYQEYTATYGYLGRSNLSERPDPDGGPGDVLITRRRPAMGGFRSDPDYVTVLALEVWDDENQTGAPAPVLLRHVNARPARKRHTADPGEALLLCLDETARVDLGVIARTLGTAADEVPGLLAGQIWEDPDGGQWVTADEYLSGNVRAKLAAAQAAAEADPGRWQGHVAALEAVQPEDLAPEDISVQLGSPWIPPDVIERFICDLLGFWQGSMGRRVTVTYAPLTAAWEVRATTNARKQPAATAEWGTLRVNAVNLIEDALNGTAPVVYDPEPGTDKRTRNAAETALATDKIRDLQERFGEWLWEDPDRADAMARIYNERFNCTRVRQYDGSLLTFPGLEGGFDPYPHQRDMVWRAVCTPATLCGHTVGAGKTAIMVMLALTLRRLGLANKPCMVVPNHLLEQETAEARRLYPGAKILMVTREDLTPERRRYFSAKIAARDWDLILMTHQQFMAMPVSPQVQADFIAGLMEELDKAIMDDKLEGATRTPKQLARQRKRLQARHDELLNAPRDGGLWFEWCGIDYVMVDEGHLFKNLEMIARAEGFSTAGSKRAADLLMKLRWLAGRNPGGRCGALFTGTPVSNSLAELHVLFRYLAPGLLDAQGLNSFDAFAGQYIRYETQTEVAPDGSGFRSYRRPRRFCNLPELRAMLWQFADIRTRADLTLDGPQVTVSHVPVPPPPEMAGFIAGLVERADKIRSGGVDEHDDNMLAICTDGRRAALDLRLAGIEPTGPGKTEAAAAKIAAVYHLTQGYVYPDPSDRALLHDRTGALQLVFCDQGTPRDDGDGQVYGRLRDALTDAGVPAGKIAFIHSAKTHADRAALFARCRNGEIAVLIGSTEKCGTGVNIQHRLIAIHHLDAPWRPADVDQRDGRGDRPRNGNPNLQVYRYVTEGSFDAYMWQALHRKALFIAQILTGDPHTREIDDAGNPQILAYGELKALATGQPLLMELSQANSEIARLRNASAGHKRTQARMHAEWNAAQTQAREHERYAAELDRIAEAAGTEADRAAADEVGRAIRLARDRKSKMSIGAHRGVRITAEPVFRQDAEPRLSVVLAASYWTEYGHTFTPRSRIWGKNGAAALLAEIDSVIDSAADRAGDRRTAKAQAGARAADIEPYLDQEWPGKQALAAALAERARIEAEIDAQVKQDAAPAAGAAERDLIAVAV